MDLKKVYTFLPRNFIFFCLISGLINNSIKKHQINVKVKI